MYSSLILLLASVGVTSVFAASKIPKCSDADIQKIKNYWNKSGGTPQYIVDSKDTYHVVMGTNSPVAGDGKCKHFSFTPPTGTQKSYILNVQESNGHFPVSESSGVLTISAGETYTSYIIVNSGYIIVALKCSKDGPVVSKTVAADVTIAVTGKVGKDHLATITKDVKGLGFNVASFNCK